MAFGSQTLPHAQPQVIVMMGVAGAGKTHVGRALATTLGWRFLEGDDYHSASNVEKMAHGHPLTDADRAPWLAALRDELGAIIGRAEHAVLACSALKQQYRDALVPAGVDRAVIAFVFLDVPRDVLLQRLATRTGHFAPPELLPSQLATLEAPADALCVDGTMSVADIVDTICRAFHLDRA
jgi:carbohydrate kinase (thermoresistant glucokinase family)